MRPMNKRRYVFAFIITAAIFFLGFFFGFLMDIKRVDYFTTINQVNQMNIRSLQLQNDLVKSGFADNQCSAFRFMFDKAIIELENNRERLELYNQQSKVGKSDFDILKREYLLSQINFYQISKNLKDSCPKQSDFVTIIYLYSDNKNCPDCDKQASVLNFFKLELKENLLIFALDEQFDDQEPIITLIKEAYNINEYPALIIDDKLFLNYTEQKTLAEILCSKYSAENNRGIACKYTS
jgi:thiol-disulfide isomerase/thioredoxin